MHEVLVSNLIGFNVNQKNFFTILHKLFMNLDATLFKC
jgi:hypothetical protein